MDETRTPPDSPEFLAGIEDGYIEYGNSAHTTQLRDREYRRGYLAGFRAAAQDDWECECETND